jgi:hypothetical protein
MLLSLAWTLPADAKVSAPQKFEARTIEKGQKKQ